MDVLKHPSDGASQPPVPAVARDIVVGPLLEGSNKSRLVFEVSGATVPLVQTKSHMGKLFESATISEMSPEKAESARLVTGPVIYAGPYLRHFGHFVAESIHRLYAKSCFPELANARVVFLGSQRRHNPIEPWLAGVLETCGVSLDEVIILNTPMRFQELHVPLQGRVLGGITLLEGYNDFFPPRPEAGKRTRKLYFTRSGHIHSGGYFGESLVERALLEAGFEIVHAERQPASTTVKAIREASVCLFSEGSAIHNLELSGWFDGKVGIVSRRPNTGSRFSYLLDGLAREWVTWGESPEADPVFTHMDWNPIRNVVSVQKGCALLDISQLLSQMSAFLEIELQIPSKAEIRDAVFQDISAYVLDPRSTAAYTPDDKLGFLLRDIREKWIAYSKALS